MNVRSWILAVGLIAYVLSTRLYDLEMDPPQAMQSHVLSDEGWWAHNAKLHAVFGQWSMDDHNPPLVSAPLYTLALRGVYALCGVGLWQTRLLSALSALSCCALMFLLVRRYLGPRTGAIAAALLATDYFTTTHGRSGFVETFQLMWILASVVAFLGPRTPRRMAVAGLLFALAILAKLSAVGLAFVYLACWIRAAVSSASVRQTLREAAAFAMAAGGTLAAVLLAVAIPNWSVFVREFNSNYLEAAGDGLNSWRNIVLFGLDSDEPSRLGGFITQSAPLLLAVAIIGLERLLRRRDQPRGDDLTLFCWTWLLAGAAFVALQRYQPDRRYLWLVPPMAILVATRLRSGPLVIGRPDDETGRRRVWPGALVIAIAIALYARGRVYGLLSTMDTFGEGTLDGRLGVAVSTALLLAAALPVGLLLLRPLRGARLRVPGLLLVAAVVAAGPARHVLDHASGTWTIPTAIQRVRDLGKTWKTDEIVVVGDQADTLTLGTGMQPVVIRDWPNLDMAFNLDAWDRFRPKIVVWTKERVPELASFRQLTPILLCPDRCQNPRLTVEVFVR